MLENNKLPFAHINLRFNPFGELDREDRAKIAVVDVNQAASFLSQHGRAIQFIADHGRGKSTHLIALHQSFPTAPYTQVHEGDKPVFSQQTLHFVDSVECLPYKQRQQLYRAANSLAITTHQDLSHELNKAGYHTLSLPVSLIKSDVLQQVLLRRIELARRNPGKLPSINLAATHKLQRDYGDNIRAIESHLYNVFQSLTEIGNVEV